MNLERIEPFKLFLYFLFIVSMICPTFLFIFLFFRDLFNALDIYRLLLLSIAITMPFILLNYFLAKYTILGQEKYDILSHLYTAVLLTMIVFYFEIVFCFFSKIHATKIILLIFIPIQISTAIVSKLIIKHFKLK